MATNNSKKCRCGTVAILLAAVRFPDRRVEEFCNKSCSAYRGAMKRADTAWSVWRRNRAAGDAGREQAAAAKATKPVPGSAEAKALAQKKANSRRERQLARAARCSAARGKSGK